MGLGGIGVWPLLLILVIVLLLFGTKKLRNMGGDLGGAIRGFKDAMSEGDKDSRKSSSESGEAEQVARSESAGSEESKSEESKSERDRHAS